MKSHIQTNSTNHFLLNWLFCQYSPGGSTVDTGQRVACCCIDAYCMLITIQFTCCTALLYQLTLFTLLYLLDDVTDAALLVMHGLWIRSLTTARDGRSDNVESQLLWLCISDCWLYISELLRSLVFYSGLTIACEQGSVFVNSNVGSRLCKSKYSTDFLIVCFAQE